METDLHLEHSEIVAFFVGKNKWTKNTKPTPVYKQPGGAPVRTIPANDSFKIERINSKGNWGILNTGEWVLLADSMYTVILTVEPPANIVEALGREAEKAIDAIPFLPSFRVMVLIAIVAVVIIVYIKLK